MQELGNFSLAIGDGIVVTLLVKSALGDTLAGSTIEWRAYPAAYGVASPPAVILKGSESPGGITILSSPAMTFNIEFDEADTSELDPGNYYHETTVIDGSGNRSTVLSGILTLTETLNP